MSRHRPLQPPTVIADRLRALRLKIQQKSLDGYLVTNPRDQFYLTGFDAEDAAVLVLGRVVYLLTDGRFAEAAAKQAPWARPVIRTTPMGQVIARVARRHRLGRIGFEPAAMLVAEHSAVSKAIRPTSLKALPGVVNQQRLIKDETEIKAITKAVRVAEEAFRTVVRRIQPGMTERELAADLQHELIRQGASGASFPIIVAAGASSSLPHARPSNRKIRAGNAVLIDWGATVEHYHSDLTRMVFVRKILPRTQRMYENVLAAQAEAIKAVRPGVRMCDVDAKARDSLAAAGMGREFAHGLGHGLGLDVHEAPRLAMRVTDKLRPGMVVTVEPGVYFPGIGGVRIEDDVLVTETGCRVLSALSKDPEDWVV